MPKKYIYWVLFLLLPIAAIVAYSFHIGYVIPQKDKHADWPEYPNHSNRNLVIIEDKKEIINFTTIPKSDLLLIYYKNPDSTNNTYGVMSRNGKLIIDLGYYTTVYIDEIHNRLIAQSFGSNDSSKFTVYDARTFKPLTAHYKNVKIEQSFDAYLKTERGIEKVDSDGYKQTVITLKSGETEALFKEKYIKKNANLASLLKGLKELYPFDDDQQDGYRNAGYVKIDQNGVIYKFEYFDKEKESIEILCKNFFDDVFRDEKSKPSLANHISTPDSSIVVANNFDSDFGLYNRGTAGSGGGSGPLWDPKFELIYLDYYQLRLHNLTTFFKQDGRKSSVAVYGIELNEPKSDNDTLVFLTESRLYYLYRIQKGN
ncbi:hypothetical protein GCM10022246_35410 [Pedobacter ginsengiterrae]|uniref:6-bladed beta-propeller protein n=1 Tax=Pedobacter ginsengiterrae TaxID=871696 RepID=A0ABP7QCE7_9SPHI